MLNSTLTRILLICSLCVTLSTARAQYVAIPDTNFGNWLLNNGYSSCLTGNSVSGFQLDTSCTAVTTATSVNCTYSNIHDLTGIQYFRNLTGLFCGQNHISTINILPSGLDSLDCGANVITSIVGFPTSLVYLICGGNQLTSLPSLPSGLIYFNCQANQLSSLPALPNSLTFLSCTVNSLTDLPSPLPNSLTYIDCGQNSLSALPALPSGMIFLSCNQNQLTSLPTLPSSMTALGCTNNLLTSLPSLPSGLIQFSCDANNLTSLPSLPASITQLTCGSNPLNALPSLPAGLAYLDCNNDQLTSLSIPASLMTLYCQNNSLTSLPPLPNTLNLLECDFNQLTSLPMLPPQIQTLTCTNNPYIYCLPPIYQNSIALFDINGTGITCLPNRFSASNYDINPATMPLCTPTSGCPFSYNITGNVHQDLSATCLQDSLNPGNPITNMKVQLLSNGQVVRQFYTFNSGNYSFQVSNYTNYTVFIDTTYLPLSVVCPISDTQYVDLTSIDTVATNVNFGIQCSNFDYAVEYIAGSHLRPTGYTIVNIGAGNQVRLLYNIDCGSNMPGTVTTALSGSITYVGPAPGALTPTSVSGNTLTYNITNLDSLTWGSLDIIVLTDTGAVAGADACFTTIITPSTPDINPYDDTLTACFTIVHSWDPNSKTVTPTSLGENADWLTYTIQFQNTGTDTAYNVVVRDTLSPYVDASSFQYIASDHKPLIQLTGNAILFSFPQINLVDSATNPPLSTGWMQYKVKSKPNLPTGTQINNTAYIYFDINPAIVTNTATSSVGVNSIVPLSSSSTIHLYPNPNRGSFTLVTYGSISSDYTISDMLGHIISHSTITSDSQPIDLPEASEGVYTLVVKGAQPIRFVIVR